ncbi:MAG: hypothetical protein KatS3mg027_1047 [Bacteroidia bacterium]|nr:MAG: hypothetical protein KatS3mg027_1047 [Bacteroidia bacterium]
MGFDAGIVNASGNPKAINAFDAGLNLNYKIIDWLNVSLGGEYLSVVPVRILK